MRCEEFEARLNAVLDERRTIASDAELRSHVAACPSCHAIARSYDAALAGLGEATRAAPDSEWAAAVPHRIVLRLRRIRRLRRTAAAVAWTAAAAVLLLAAWPALRGNLRHKVDDDVAAPDELAGPVPPAVPADAGNAGAGGLAGIARDATYAYWGLARQTEESVAYALLLVSRLNRPHPAAQADGTASPDEDASSVQKQGASPAATVVQEHPAPGGDEFLAAATSVGARWIDGLAGSIQTVAEPTADAVLSLLLAIPDHPEDRRL